MSCICDVHKEFISKCGYSDLTYWCNEYINYQWKTISRKRFNMG